MSLKVSNIIRKLIFTGSLFWAVSAQAQQDSLFLSVEQLFESGIKSSLQLQSDSLKERMAHERKLYAKTGLLPDLEIGLKGGIIGQPVVFQNGLSNPEKTHQSPILRKLIVSRISFSMKFSSHPAISLFLPIGIFFSFLLSTAVTIFVIIE